MIVDLPATDFIETYVGSENPILEIHTGEKGRMHLVRLERTWLHVPLWFPITQGFHTCADLFGIYAPNKFDDFYDSETFQFLKQGVGQFEEAPLSDVFVLGGDGNYCHLLFKFLPRLAFMKVNPQLQNLRLLVDTNLDRTQWPCVKYVLDRLDLPPMDYAALDEGFFPLAHAFAPTRFGLKDAVRIWNTMILPPDHAQGSRSRRLFVERNDVRQRRLLNQDEVRDYLSGRDFKCIDPGVLPFEEQIALFADANLIVGVHGAALANLMFTPPGGHFIELLVDETLDWFQRVAALQGITSDRVFGEPVEDVGKVLPQNRDFHIDLEKLKAALRPFL